MYLRNSPQHPQNKKIASMDRRISQYKPQTVNTDVLHTNATLALVKHLVLIDRSYIYWYRYTHITLQMVQPRAASPG